MGGFLPENKSRILEYPTLHKLGIVILQLHCNRVTHKLWKQQKPFSDFQWTEYW